MSPEPGDNSPESDDDASESGEDLHTQLERASRAAAGDALRRVVYFTADDHEGVYTREGLEEDADPEEFVTNERLGFTSQVTYGDSALGSYRGTVRLFEEGYLTRVIVGDRGVFATTDELDIERLRELTEALDGILEVDAE